MIAAPLYPSPAELCAALVGDPLGAYRHTTPSLERTLALLRTSYGGAAEKDYHAAMRRAEDSIAATLRARRQLDAAEPTPEPAPGPTPEPGGGSRVPVPAAPPDKPLSPAAALPPWATIKDF